MRDGGQRRTARMARRAPSRGRSRRLGTCHRREIAREASRRGSSWRTRASARYSRSRRAVRSCAHRGGAANTGGGVAPYRSATLESPDRCAMSRRNELHCSYRPVSYAMRATASPAFASTSRASRPTSRTRFVHSTPSGSLSSLDSAAIMASTPARLSARTVVASGSRGVDSPSIEHRVAKRQELPAHHQLAVSQPCVEVGGPRALALDQRQGVATQLRAGREQRRGDTGHVVRLDQQIHPIEQARAGIVERGDRRQRAR